LTAIQAPHGRKDTIIVDGLKYRFRQASWDYGPSPTPKDAVVMHMAEGVAVESYLAQGKNEKPRAPRVLRGVSSHFIVAADGEVVQMLPLDNISGSLNPRDVRTSDSAFYGRRYTRFLGKVTDGQLAGGANRRTISIEVAGFASREWSGNPPGLTKAQADSVIELVRTLRKHYKRSIGFTGHADFADYKACPGTGFQTKRVFDVLGHGAEKSQPQPEPEDPTCDELAAELVKVRARLVVVKGRVNDMEDTILGLRETIEKLTINQATVTEARDLAAKLEELLATITPNEG